MNKILAVVGPTGSGKTALAVRLAKKFNGVLVSADSRQVYIRLDIGTNKEGQPGEWQGVTARNIDGVPQLMIDLVEPGTSFTLNDWLEETRKLLPRIWATGHLPIIVGGTGLYVTALLEGYRPGGGRYAKDNYQVNFQSLVLQPELDRKALNEKSDKRCSAIFDSLASEIKQLLSSGVSADWLNKIGLDYRYGLKQIAGELSREEAIAELQVASRQYIRRQLTWWRHHGPVRLVKNAAKAETMSTNFLGNENPGKAGVESKN